MKKYRIDQIQALLDKIPKSPWHYSEGDDYDHWELWNSDLMTGIHMVQDDKGVLPDKGFIEFVLQARSIIEELIKEVKQQQIYEAPPLEDIYTHD